MSLERARISYVFILSIVVALAAVPAFAQSGNTAAAGVQTPSRFESVLRAADSVTTKAGNTTIKLWALEPVSGMTAAFNLKARTALDNAIGQGKATCEVRKRTDDAIYAQCINDRDQDLGLAMIQEGFATVAREDVFGTVFEDAYVQAESQAQRSESGVWGKSDGTKTGDSSVITTLIVSAIVVFVLVFIGLAILSFIVMRGFQKIIENQKKSTEYASQDRALRDRERHIFAVMVDSEMKANSAKIEAYLAVYEETLRGWKQGDQARRGRAGEIVQKQPALSRAVFDRNTDKLDVLGDRLASALVHFYARVKSNPEYLNFDVNASPNDVIAALENVLERARKLSKLAENILITLSDNGVISDNYDSSF